MKNLVFAVLGLALAGAIGGLALPLVEVGGLKVMLLDAGGQGYFTLSLFVVAAAVAGLFFKTGEFVRWQGIVTLIAFLIAGMKVSEGEGASGQTVMMLSAFAGMLVSIALIVKPVRK